MVMKDVSLLRELQLLQLELLDKCVDICNRNNIKYYLIGGTLIGAVRHKGFIPWDDDIDIAIERSDYNKFISIAKEELKDPYGVVHYTTDDNYRFYLVNIVNKNVNVTIQKETPITSNISIDILPIDGIPNNKFMMYVHKFRIYYYRCLAGFVNIDYIRNKKRSFIEKIMILIGKKIRIGRIIDLKKVRIKTDEYVEKYKYDDCRMVGTFFGNYGFHEVVPKDYFGDGCEVLFEGKKYMAPSKVDEYLTHMYGEYMSLPPKEKQVGHHIISVEKK